MRQCTSGQAGAYRNPRDRTEHREQDQPRRVHCGVFRTMSDCGWLSHPAARRWLIVLGTFLWAGHVAAQAPEDQRVPQPSPTVEEENQRNTWAGTQPQLPPSLLRLFQSEEDEATEKDRASKSGQ